MAILLRAEQSRKVRETTPRGLDPESGTEREKEEGSASSG
jgi:hypothetical protein